MANFRNFYQQCEPDLSAGQLVSVPGLPLKVPLWYVKNLPTPNVGTGALLPFNSPAVSYAASSGPPAQYVGSQPMGDFECKCRGL
jgi:hypothetical protein